MRILSRLNLFPLNMDTTLKVEHILHLKKDMIFFHNLLDLKKTFDYLGLIHYSRAQIFNSFSHHSPSLQSPILK